MYSRVGSPNHRPIITIRFFSDMRTVAEEERKEKKKHNSNT